ncbi:hypothetical protein O1611_g3406 [Lasiodiplodia mahajangana]|uniref:Uncharacterized protein n=1 Tax=Lasiodiplodia mahajangana TaxID=1108764 RepID=A0ACC2JSQ3_9PEZI|nr:hypothetical protein O1611_g3406 [Lasiodiplodia mahajangana]
MKEMLFLYYSSLAASKLPIPSVESSKRDSIETKSEPEEIPRRPSLTPKTTIIPAPATSHSTTPTYTIHKISDPIQAVIVRCDAERRWQPLWCATEIPTEHAVFSRPVPPIPMLIEIPLVFYRLGTQSSDREGLNNQIVTSININATSGFAPPDWKTGVGSVIVARKDKKPLLPHHLEGIWMYCDYILSFFNDRGGAPNQLYSREAFESWWQGYRDDQRLSRGGTGGEEDADDWRAVRSPYAY